MPTKKTKPRKGDVQGYQPGPVPAEAIDFLKKKGLKPGFSYKNVWAQEHVAAFTVAKGMKLDLLTDIKSSIEDALKEGTPFAQFVDDIEPTLAKHGWWGENVSVTNPDTGLEEIIEVNDNRLRTIYDTNMRTARAAGQWERIEETKELRPLLRYTLGPSDVHRPEHEAWEGITLPVDDEFWDTHTGPSDYGCKCSVIQVTEEEAADLPNAKWEAPDEEMVPWTNDVTGESGIAPKGINPTFAFNPGKERLAGLKDAVDDKEIAAED